MAHKLMSIKWRLRAGCLSKSHANDGDGDDDDGNGGEERAVAADGEKSIAFLSSSLHSRLIHNC